MNNTTPDRFPPQGENTVVELSSRFATKAQVLERYLRARTTAERFAALMLLADARLCESREQWHRARGGA